MFKLSIDVRDDRDHSLKLFDLVGILRKVINLGKIGYRQNVMYRFDLVGFGMRWSRLNRLFSFWIYTITRLEETVSSCLMYLLILQD